jgi:hypothetical protein
VAVNREVTKVIIDIFKDRDLKITMPCLHEVSIQTVVWKLSDLSSRTPAPFTRMGYFQSEMRQAS